MKQLIKFMVGVILMIAFFSQVSKAQSVDGSFKVLTTTGSADTYVVSEALPSAYNPKERFLVRFHIANTGTSTLNRFGLGAKTIKKNKTDNLVSGDIKTGQTHLLAYDGTDYECLSCASAGGSPSWTLASGGTLTGNNTITMGANTVTFTGNKVSFTPDATNPGINIGSFAGAPSTLANGDLWYNSTAGHFIGRQGASNKPFMQFNSATITGNRIPYAGSSSGFTESANLTFDGTGMLIGGGTITANTRLDIRGTGTTTNNIFRLADSGNNERLSITDEGKFIANAVGGVPRFTFAIAGTAAMTIESDGSTSVGAGSDLRLGRANNSLAFAVAGTNEVFKFWNNEDVDQYGFYFQMGTGQTHTTGSTREYFTLDGNTLTSASGTVAAKHLTLKSTFNVQGTGQLTYVSAEPTFTDYDGPVTGYDWNPTTPANIAGSHIAWRNTSGGMLVNGSTITASTPLDVRGISAGNVTRFADNSNAPLVTLLNAGNLQFGTSASTYIAPSSGDASVDITGTSLLLSAAGNSTQNRDAITYNAGTSTGTSTGAKAGHRFRGTIGNSSSSASANFTHLSPVFNETSGTGALTDLFIESNYNNFNGDTYGIRMTTVGNSWGKASGAQILVGTAFQKTVNQTGTSTGSVTGFFHDPTITSITGNHYSFRSTSGSVEFSQAARTQSWLPAIKSTAGAHTGLTASTEFVSHDFTGATQQWATGTLTSQRWNYFRGYTAAFVGASTLTNAYTVYIDPPVAGTNATITNNYALGVNGSKWQLGKSVYDATITGGGTTGNQTINKPTGTVNIAAAGTTVTVTNSFCTTSSIVYAVIRTNDATATIKNVVPGSGSFVINLNAAATAETSVGFIVFN